MNKFIKILSAINKAMQFIWPYLVALATGAVIVGCSVDRVLVNVEKARTAGMEGEACCNDGADTAAAAAVAK